MAYKLKFHPAAGSDFYKLTKRNKLLGKVIIDTHIKKILTNPYKIGIKKSGDLSNIYGYNFNFKGVSYRILYEIKSSTIRIMAAGVHDVAYRKS